MREELGWDLILKVGGIDDRGYELLVVSIDLGTLVRFGTPSPMSGSFVLSVLLSADMDCGSDGRGVDHASSCCTLSAG